MSQTPFLELKNISKDFNGTVVLQDASFRIEAGEIIGLVGENGAGKTTLMSILFGMPVITETGGYGGQILIDGKEVHFESPFDALKAGIGMVHQEFSLIPGFVAAENVCLNREALRPSILTPIFGERLGTIDRNEMEEVAEKAIGKLGVSIKADTLVSEMPVGHKQFTEIAREISRENVRLLVLDEPTAVLTETEADMLLAAIKALSEQGISIIFISHRLREVTEVCDRVITLRDGKMVCDAKTADTTVEKIAASMVGREVKATVTTQKTSLAAEEIFQVEHLWVDMPGETVRDVSFSVHKGEIFGIAGLAGQGKLGIPNGIMGLYPAGGKVVFEGKEIALNSPTAALDAHLAFVSEDRRGVGLLLDESLEWNIAFSAIESQNRFLKPHLGGLVKLRDEQAMRETAEKYVKMLAIKCTGTKQKAKELSGGNQQKICLAKAFCLGPKLLLVSEPTRGIDIGAKQIVLDTLRKFNEEEDLTIIMVSSELVELQSICDRIAVVTHGKIAGILPPEEEPTKFALLMSDA